MYYDLIFFINSDIILIILKDMIKKTIFATADNGAKIVHTGNDPWDEGSEIRKQAYEAGKSL